MISDGTCQTGLPEYPFHRSPSDENEINSPSYVKRIPRNLRSGFVSGLGSRALERTPFSACEPTGSQLRAGESPNLARFNSGLLHCSPSIELATPMRYALPAKL